ncbi:DUF1643 domain-containing protein [Methanothermococcus okinawensis]|uniref:DUF1643 domain-containing protein n=1 Tax=Methanothermococcus okinawensis (strain DSM 14208 / JCM 11175 / IH1) TaxID=647113 RepID=F8ALB3_METOI|nr:DUF1643 domain-containing protein [Methanothermococcus okinawensis]AEH06501.1 protein of unknown function DUF1643 [Methanothermococcus okinawensis IH1]
MNTNMNPRIGRQVKHFEAIDIKNISAVFSEDNVYRYTLEMKYNDRENYRNTMTVILKNPSSANEKKADNTIRRVEKYVYEKFHDVSHLNILNIFAYRATDAKDLNNALMLYGLDYVVGLENDKYIKSFVKESDYIIKAWGGNSGINKKLYNQRINQVNNMLAKITKKQNIPVYRVDGNGKGNDFYPFHACFWGYNMRLIEYRQ